MIFQRPALTTEHQAQSPQGDGRTGMPRPQHVEPAPAETSSFTLQRPAVPADVTARVGPNALVPGSVRVDHISYGTLPGLGRPAGAAGLTSGVTVSRASAACHDGGTGNHTERGKRMPTYTGGGANKGDASTNTEPEAEATEPQATAKEPTTESGHAEALGE